MPTILPCKTKQQGAAIIVALFVVALVATASIAILTRLQQDTRRAELFLNSNQAYLYAQGSILWAADQLLNNNKEQKTDHLIDKIPLRSPSKKINNAIIESTIYDAQGFFNLNNLADTNYQTSFKRLIKTIMPAMKDQDIQNLISATVDWISASNQANFYQNNYAKLIPSYRAPHRLMSSMSELRLVSGMTPVLFNKLLPHIIALPSTTPININTATPPVLMSLSPSLTIESAQTIIAAIKKSPYPTVQKFMNFDVVKNNAFNADNLTVTSTYFLVKTQVSIGDQIFILYTLMQRETKNSQPTISILWQSKGTL